MKNLVAILMLVLSLAVINYNKVIAEVIAEPPKRDIVKYRELTEYVINGDIENVKLLIKAGVNVNSIFGDGDEGYIPLHEAVSNGDMAMIKVLVEAGANVNTISNWNMSAIDFTDRQDIAEYLIANGSDMKRLNIVSWAGFGFIEKVEESLKNKESIETQSGFSGYTPLIIASGNGHLEVVKYLLKEGANIEAKSDDREETALNNASSRGQLEVVKYLVEQGADIETVDVEGLTPLHNAIYYSHASIVKYLIEQGADRKDAYYILERATPFNQDKFDEVVKYLNSLK